MPPPPHARPTTILFLAANPIGTTVLSSDAEQRDINRSIQFGTYRDQFNLIAELAVRGDQLVQLLEQHHPDIIHFSCHADDAGALLLHGPNNEQHPVTPTALAGVFAAVAWNVRCIVFNACYSVAQATALSPYVKAVVGMTRAIGEVAAIEFGKGFYAALANGRLVTEAFALGQAQLQVANLPNDANVLQLLAAAGAQFAFVNAAPQVADGQDAIAARLRTRRPAAQRAPRRRYKIDSDRFLVDFDLTKPVASFKDRVSELSPPGVYPFTLATDETFVRQSLLPRLSEELRRLLVQNIDIREVSIFSGDVPGDGALAALPVVDGRLDDVTLNDLLSQHKDNCLLAIWNRDVPPPAMERFASLFLTDVQNQYGAVLKQQGLLLIVLWINAGGQPLALAEITPLPPPELNEAYAVNWLRKSLAAAKVDDADIDACEQRLRAEIRRHNGWPPRVFSALHDILYDLQQGRL